MKEEIRNARKDCFIGKIYKTKEGYNLKVIAWENNQKITVIFDYGYSIVTRKATLEKGGIKNPYHPSVCGIGYMGVGKYKSTTQGRANKNYEIWLRMIQRCYDERIRYKFPTYKETTVCEEWHNFQNFAKWHEENWKSWMDNKWQLDKDILCKDCKSYSPYTCCFLPAEINSLFTNIKSNKGEFATGVSFCKQSNKFKAQISIDGKTQHIGSYDTELEASYAYNEIRILRIKEVVERWKSKIIPRIYNSILYNRN